MSEGEMRFSPNGIFKRADEFYKFAIEWQLLTGQLLLLSERTYEDGEWKIEDAKARKAWLEKKEMEESARTKKRTGGKRVDPVSDGEGDWDFAVEPIVFGNRRCVSRQGSDGKDKSNAWIWNGELFGKRI